MACLSFLQVSLGLRQVDFARSFPCDEVGNPRIRLLEIRPKRGIRAALLIDLSAQVVQQCVFGFALAPQRADSHLADPKLGCYRFELPLEALDLRLEMLQPERRALVR